MRIAHRSWPLGLLAAGTVLWSSAVVSVQGSRAQAGWTIPATATAEKNPLSVNDAVLAAGRRLFASKCQRCHGPEGLGNGPDADPKHREHMDLTSGARAAQNPDGVVFYKLWNGRSSPRMPTFSEELSREQAWAIVAFVQSLRRKS